MTVYFTGLAIGTVVFMIVWGFMGDDAGDYAREIVWIAAGVLMWPIVVPLVILYLIGYGIRKVWDIWRGTC